MESNIELKTLPNGKPNSKYIDLLDEDSAVAGQKFVCVSFLSPETILKKREIFMFEKFVEQWDMSKSLWKFSEFLNFLAFKYNISADELMKEYSEFIVSEEKKLKADSRAIEDDYKNFLDKYEEKLNAQFSSEHSFQTSVRGLKIRGSFNTQEEAELHCKKLRERDPNHDIYVAPIGVWLPWEPTYYKLERVEYLEPELNQLYQEKMKNETQAKNEFEQRVKDAKRKAIEENVRKARASGNKLTQTIDSEGNLVGANTMNFEDREVADPMERENHEKEVLNKVLEEKTSVMTIDI